MAVTPYLLEVELHLEEDEIEEAGSIEQAAQNRLGPAGAVVLDLIA